MASFELDKQFTDELKSLITQEDHVELNAILAKLYAADIAELYEELNKEEVVFLNQLLEPTKRVEVLIELEDKQRDQLLEAYSSPQIANELVAYMDSDDAADILNDLPAAQTAEIVASIKDRDFARNIVSLFNYADDSAGGLMAKELVKVNIDWTINQCVDEIRKQAEEVSTVYTVYVVDDFGTLMGKVSLKKIILSDPGATVSQIFDGNIISCKAYDSGEQVAQMIRKYDLVALPVTDSLDRLIGRITVDDVIDFIQDEAEEDYQLLSGLSERVESDDSVWRLSRARLPWLIIGMMGGVGSSVVIGGFEESISRNVQLAFFMPLIMAMGGNAGVQASSIIVQGLANNSLDPSQIFKRIGKEFFIAMLNGVICGALLLGYSLIVGNGKEITAVVSLSLLIVIMLANIMGAFIPLVLERFKVDPALATGPFITTTNDLLGLLLYFLIGNAILGM